ncbi:HlyC/CorC family transporter [Wolbachia endosymbiont of Howardula sp.]|uniref:HlyC/CorC family transporter n=1 Tax=Wolbachia endosymbiont of Howardula sp. TaxID=2916816 RepID=UPI00217DA12C|nr:CNNM domain-containing protein [Wolbachia endosymbiont of Howardula sp.]UWI82994.1 CNNM domain-containing protein [Wolbachia endosymbiont of Howardula sp.]
MNWLLVLLSLVILILLILSFLFSGAEIGLTTISRSRVNKLKLDGNKRAHIISLLLSKKELTIGTILFGNTIITLTYSALFTAIFINFFGNESIVLSTIIMTFCILLFCEMLPKTYAMQNPEKFASFSAYFLLFFVKFFSPLTLAIQCIVNLILTLCGLHKDKEVISAADAMRNMLTLHHSDGTMLQRDLEMLSSILDLAETKISQIMTYKKHLFSLNINQNKEALIEKILTSSYSRIPLWNKDIEDIIGVIHVKDLINVLREKNNKIEDIQITKIISKPWFISESTLLSVQLHNFRQNRKHFALVIDEYKLLQGIVTLEDILEEIVGEISDEHDLTTDTFIYNISNEIYHIAGKAKIKDINQQLHLELPEDSTTLSGMIIKERGYIPEERDEYVMYGCLLKILKKNKNMIILVEVQINTDNDTISITN